MSGTNRSVSDNRGLYFMRILLSAAGFKRIFVALSLLGGSLLLSSCGGGAASVLLSGVGSGGTGLVEGIVVGFGSVFIDGKEYTTTNATVQEDDEQGQPQVALLKLGQRVRASIDSTGNAVVAATIIPGLSGPVTSTATQDASGDWWARVLGQWVHIVNNATNTPMGLTTVLAGTSGVTPSPPLSVGNEVQVHGLWAWDAAHNAYVLVASRVDILSPTPLTGNVLLGGVVTALPASGQAMINSTPGGVILQGTMPAGLVAGQSLSAWVTRNVWAAWAGGTTPLSSYAVSVADLAAQAGSTAQNAQLSGLVSNYSAATNTATVQGTRVTLPSGMHVGDGDYIRLSGQVSAGVLTQTTVNEDTPATGAVTPQTIQVLGTTNGIGWSAGGSISFILQGTSVTAPSGTYGSCANLVAQNTVAVALTGLVPAPGQPVVATAVTCTPVTAPASGSVADFHGTIQSVSGSSAMLQNEDRVLTVLWTATTYIDPSLGSAGTSWSGQRVEVIGTLTGSTLAASVIRLDGHGTND